MKKLLRVLIIALTFLLLIALSGCGKNNIGEAGRQPVNLKISAAASLKDALDELNEQYKQTHAGVSITTNYGSSGSLVLQIEQGADIDLFLSAATKQMDQLKNKGLLVADTERNLLSNQLVLIVPADSSANLLGFAGLTKADIKKLALGEPESVPAGKYAEEVLNNLEILDSVKSKIVYGQNVREVLTWVKTGNVDAGIVYASDVQTSSQVKIAAIAAEDTHTPIVYPAAVIESSENLDAASAYLDYLGSSEAQAVFAKHGFKSH